MSAAFLFVVQVHRAGAGNPDEWVTYHVPTPDIHLALWQQQRAEYKLGFCARIEPRG